MFYNEPVENINIIFFYLNNKEIERIREQNIEVKDGIIDKDQLIYIINDNKYILKTKYYLTSILKYNVLVEPNEIYEILTQKEDDLQDYCSFQKLRSIDEVEFKDTITILNDYNKLFIVFNKSKPNKGTTRKSNAGKHRNTRKKI
jgi:hypothetical protein